MSELRVKNRAKCKLRNHSSDAVLYRHGYPAYSVVVEPNVACQYIYNEASGNIVDTVAGVTLTGYGGTRTYNVAAAVPWDLISPGISCGNGSQFYAASTPTATDITTSFVYEIICQSNVGATGSGHIYLYSGVPTATQIKLHSGPGSPAYFTLILAATDGTSASIEGTLDTDYCDGAIHKWRIAGTLGGTCTVYVDGISKLSGSLAALSGKTVRSTIYAAPYASDVTMYEYRFTNGNATNNSGGPGGG